LEQVPERGSCLRQHRSKTNDRAHLEQLRPSNDHCEPFFFKEDSLHNVAGRWVLVDIATIQGLVDIFGIELVGCFAQSLVNLELKHVRHKVSVRKTKQQTNKRYKDSVKSFKVRGWP